MRFTPALIAVAASSLVALATAAPADTVSEFIDKRCSGSSEEIRNNCIAANKACIRRKVNASGSDDKFETPSRCIQKELDSFIHVKNQCHSGSYANQHGICLAAVKTCMDPPEIGGVTGAVGVAKWTLKQDCFDRDLAGRMVCSHIGGSGDDCPGLVGRLVSEVARGNREFHQCLASGQAPGKQGPSKDNVTQAICNNKEAKQMLRYRETNQCVGSLGAVLDLLPKSCFEADGQGSSAKPDMAAATPEQSSPSPMSLQAYAQNYCAEGLDGAKCEPAVKSCVLVVPQTTRVDRQCYLKQVKQLGTSQNQPRE